MLIGGIVLGSILREIVELVQLWDGPIDLSLVVRIHS